MPAVRITRYPVPVLQFGPRNAPPLMQVLGVSGWSGVISRIVAPTPASVATPAAESAPRGGGGWEARGGGARRGGGAKGEAARRPGLGGWVFLSPSTPGPPRGGG